MDTMVGTALTWGAISAISLPIGAVLGLLWQPGSRWTSGLMAFGAGALLFALSVELLGEVPDRVAADGMGALGVAIVSTLGGVAVFDTLNQLLNNRGAFLRNLSNARTYVALHKRNRARRILRRLVDMEAFAPLSAHQLSEMVKNVRRHDYVAGEAIFEPGERPDFLYFVRRGEVRINNGEEIVVGEGEIFGDTPIVLDEDYATRATATRATTLYMISDDTVQEAMERDEELKAAMLKLARSRPGGLSAARTEKLEAALEDLEEDLIPVSETDIEEEPVEARGMSVAVAVWLGITIDAIPESLVIGTMAISAGGVSMAFIAGVFLANLPEAMASAVAMRLHRMSIRRILTMWSSIVLLTAAGAGLGSQLFSPDPGEGERLLVLGVQAMAAGAMLTAIAESMLPEAYEQGGAVVGIATSLGFLSALSIGALHP